MEQRHVIKRQVIELTVKNRATAPALQDKVSSIYRQRILPLIERYCTELGQPDRLYRIDSLELDLGILEGEDIEAELVARTEDIFHKALSAQIASQDAESTQPGRSLKAQSALELFIFFMQTGSLPWWADDSEPKLLAENLERLLNESPDELRRLLQSWALDEGLQRRLVSHFGDGQLAQLAELLIPAWQITLEQDTKALKSLLEQTKPGAASSQIFVRQRLWTRVLQTAGLGGSQYPSPTDFYQAVLKRVAADLGASYTSLVDEIRQGLQGRKRMSASPGFKAFIQSLDEFNVGVSATTGRNSELVQRLEQLRTASTGALTEAWAALQAWLPRLADSAQARWLTALNETGTQPLPQTAATRLLEHVRPEQAAHYGLPANELSKLMAMFQAGLDTFDQQRPRGDEALLSILQRYQSQGGLLAEAWAALRAARVHLSGQTLAAWVDALNTSRSDTAAKNALRLLGGDAAQHGLPDVERSRLAELFSSALDIVRQTGSSDAGGDLAALLERYASQGGPLVEAWEMLRELSQQLEPVALAAWLEALTASSRQDAAENAIRLLEDAAVRHGLSETERASLAGLFSSALETDQDEAAGRDVGKELAVVLERYESQGGLLADAWRMLRMLSSRLSSQAQSAWLDALTSIMQGESAAENAIRLLNAGAAQHGLGSNERTGLLRLLRAATGPQPGDERPDLRFSQADEIAVANAGLVILWPFLASFFTHLGLVEERQFKDLPAHQRGVGLLQFLAAKQADPAEYLLPLNKVLCGLEPKHVFDFGPPLRKNEQKECTSLLKAVIAQAPILHNMSPDGFRGNFLLRRGQLSVRDGLWLLRVERQTYDIVLERFPWSWQWVKLPWMETPLQIEW